MPLKVISQMLRRTHLLLTPFYLVTFNDWVASLHMDEEQLSFVFKLPLAVVGVDGMISRKDEVSLRLVTYFLLLLLYGNPLP